ncbi:MAG: histidine phosphatase family protein [Oscillospiraceae bacterium]|jgi:alpha-ribazole phosphatase
MKTCRIHLLRSGLTEAAVKGVYRGSTDTILDRAGRKALSETASSLHYPYVEKVYTGDITADQESAGIMFPGVEIVSTRDLNGMGLGVFEGMSFDELKDSEAFQKWVSPSGGYVPDGGELPADFSKRVVSAVTGIVKSCFEDLIPSVAVVASMGVIGAILAEIGLPKADSLDWQCDNGYGYTCIADSTLFYREPVLEIVSKIPTKGSDGEDGPYHDEADDDWVDDGTLDAWMKDDREEK